VTFLVAHQPPQSAVTALNRVVALAPRVARSARVLARVSAGAVAGVWIVCVPLARPESSTEWLSRDFLLAAAIAPAVFLTLFASGIDDLIGLPQRYREMGADVRSRMSDLAARGDQRRGGAFRQLIGLARAAIVARDLVSPLTLVTTVLRPIMLVGALVAAVIALLEIPAAGVILVLVLM
jgi:hypothetical protein